ncbi:Phosphoribosylformimino-5-aminoimidazole carboxamide ribotide isomerase [Viridothelium virens]|uniref:1-(5-phosphoribosyl)-5-[(5-phosphoribosylamino)methylideneamino] imidazole-4-carboxamide isomerase n=1 Tax=Viridothelium virens TaxID=1048519 RepID=A0A6A6HL85_VIRVR|nr:Phosphoribosylformimino-5-aminoimidazole carboxamide ribotide isomerase [Viridothelium virens]
MTIFRPCIDLHAGQVKQIDPSSLTHALTNPPPAASSADSSLKENYVSHLPASYYAQLYHDAELRGGHVIKLGPGNDDAAREALGTWPGGLQVGGGIDEGIARGWVEAGAEKVIITSYLFPSARFSLERLKAVLAALGGDREKLVVDVSCKQVQGKWVVAMDKWTRLTDMEVNQDSIHVLAPFCSELLIHAADKEGLQRGIDNELVACLGTWCRSVPAEYQPFAITYAGGGRSIEDLENVKRLSGGLVDLTIGSALDIFGGKGVRFEDCVKWNRRQETKTGPERLD